MHTFLLTFLTFLLLTITGCGGGGGGEAGTSTSSTATPSSSTTTQTATAYPSITPTSDDTIKITDASAVEGLTVLCGNTELTTNREGEFKCTSLPFSIFLGEYKLGEINKLPFDRILLTQNIMQVSRGAITYPEVTKVSTILQTLDEDANPHNGITLKNDTIEILNAQLSQNSKLEDFSLEDVSSMLKDVVRTRKEKNANSRLQLFSSQEAQENLANMTAQIPAPTYEQRLAGSL